MCKIDALIENVGINCAQKDDASKDDRKCCLDRLFNFGNADGQDEEEIGLF